MKRKEVLRKIGTIAMCGLMTGGMTVGTALAPVTAYADDLDGFTVDESEDPDEDPSVENKLRRHAFTIDESETQDFLLLDYADDEDSVITKINDNYDEDVASGYTVFATKDIKSVKSSNTKVATVKKTDDREIEITYTGNAGKATITVTAKDGETATLDVTIKNNFIKSKTYSVKTYQNKTISVSDLFELPNRNVTINSVDIKNDKKRYVDVGWESKSLDIDVRGLKTGTDVITVHFTYDGKNYTATLTVNVKKGGTFAIYDEKGDNTLATKIKTITLDADKYSYWTLNPNGEIKSVKSNNTSVAQVSKLKASDNYWLGQVKIAPKKAGTAKITVTSTNGDAYTFTVKVKSTQSATTKKNNTKKNSALKLYVNKKAVSNISMKAGAKATTVSITSGKKIKSVSATQGASYVTVKESSSTKFTVKPKKAGKATITVKTTDGKSATLIVTVKKK